MNETGATQFGVSAAASTNAAPTDESSAAHGLDGLWNSSASVHSWDEVEWQCNTWGSSSGFSDWTDTGTFTLVAQLFNLSTSSSGRDELVVRIPLEAFPRVRLIERIGDYPKDGHG